MRVTESVILAAGHGSRLNGGAPKPLVEVAGQPLIARALEQARAAGCERVIVVLGSHADQVRRYVEGDAPRDLQIDFVYNPRYDAPNGISLLAAEDRLSGPFYLQMVDHVFAGPVLARLAAGGRPAAGSARLLVDLDPEGIDEDDATRVACRDGLVRRIGKGIVPWDAVDAGVFLVDPTVLERARGWALEAPSISAIMQRLADDGGLAAVDIDGVRWADVDTPRDRSTAAAVLAADGVSRRPRRRRARRCG